MIIKDKLTMHDDCTVSVSAHKKTFRTKIITGTDPWVDKKTGVTYLGEVWDENENETTIGGSIYTLSKLFNDKSPVNVKTLNSILGVNPGYTIDSSNGYPIEHSVCLFGVGIGGAGESSFTTYKENYDATTLASMVPFRFTTDELSETDKQRYWMRKTIQATETDPERVAYYLKTIDSHAIRVLWEDAEGGNSEVEVEDSDIGNPNITGNKEVFEELVLTISKEDIIEYFQYNGNTPETRINEIGLFSGQKVTYNGVTDYMDVSLFSICNINNEMLKRSNGMTIIYRIYTN